MNIRESLKAWIMVLMTSKRLCRVIELKFLKLPLTVVFTLSFKSHEISWTLTGLIGFLWRNKSVYNLIWVNGFHYFENNRFQKQKKMKFLLFFVYLLPRLVNYSSQMTLLLTKEVTSVQKLMLLKMSWWNYWLRHRFSAKKSNFWFLSKTDALFVDLRHILNDYRSQALPMDE